MQGSVNLHLPLIEKQKNGGGAYPSLPRVFRGGTLAGKDKRPLHPTLETLYEAQITEKQKSIIQCVCLY